MLVSVLRQDGQTYIIMPGINRDSQSTTEEDSQSNEVPSSTGCENTDIKPSVAVATPSESANQECRRQQVLQDNTVASDGVNLANVDHIQTVVTAQPTTSYEHYPGLCPICGDKISGILHLLLFLTCKL